MINRRRHNFNDCTVITGLCPNGDYGAYQERDEFTSRRGYGHSRFAAIADLSEQVSHPSDDEEPDHWANVCDHNRKLRAEAM